MASDLKVKGIDKYKRGATDLSTMVLELAGKVPGEIPAPVESANTPVALRNINNFENRVEKMASILEGIGSLKLAPMARGALNTLHSPGVASLAAGAAAFGLPYLGRKAWETMTPDTSEIESLLDDPSVPETTKRQLMDKLPKSPSWLNIVGAGNIPYTRSDVRNLPAWAAGAPLALGAALLTAAQFRGPAKKHGWFTGGLGDKVVGTGR